MNNNLTLNFEQDMFTIILDCKRYSYDLNLKLQSIVIEFALMLQLVITIFQVSKRC